MICGNAKYYPLWKPKTYCVYIEANVTTREPYAGKPHVRICEAKIGEVLVYSTVWGYKIRI